MKEKIKPPLMVLPLRISKKITRPFMGIAYKLDKLFTGLKYDLEQTDIKLSSQEYLIISLLNAFLFQVLFFFLLFVLSYRIQSKPLQVSILTSLGYSFLIFLLIIFALLRYPKIFAGKKAEQIDKHLVFALKDLLLQISSSVSLYNGLINVSKAGYGVISVEFEKVAKAVSVGTPIEQALEKMALGSKSEFLKRTIWQLINTLKAGASLKGALRTIIDELTVDQRSKIRDYAHELNLWALIYMLFAVAVPTIGATMMVILSSFAGAGISQPTFVAFIIFCFIVQFVIIGLVKSRRPIVHL